MRKLRDYVRAEAGGSLASSEVFLLRNLSKGKGIGFFNNYGFFPDFILWIKNGRHQRIVFVEPHGMRQSKAYWRDDKVRLHERLRVFGQRLRLPKKRGTVELDSFIISATPYDELRQIYGEGDWDRRRFAEHHILFQEHEDYAGALFARQSEEA